MAAICQTFAEAPLKIYSVAHPHPKPGDAGYPVCDGLFFPTRQQAETHQRERGGTIEELEVDDYSDDARDFYRLWPADFPRPPFPVAIDNLMARYAGDDPKARATVLESAARVLRGGR